MAQLELIPLYKSILEASGLVVDKEGLVSMELGGDLHPAECQNKRLALPTGERLRSGEWQGLQPFHPIAENIYRGESPVLKKLRAIINFRVASIISCLLTELIEIAANTDYHSKLSPTQSEYLTLVSNVDAKTVGAFEKVLSKMSPTGEHRLTSIYLKRGGTLKGEKFSRLAVASFPITDEFGNKEHTLFGVKVRAKDQKAFENLFDFLLPHAHSIESYSVGSNAMTAPYLHALLLSFAKIAKQLNKVTHKFRKHLDNPEALHINLDWVDSLDDLSVYRDLIPTLSGNEGEPMVGEEGKAQESAGHTAAAKALLSDPGTSPAPDATPKQATSAPWEPAQAAPVTPQPTAPAQPAASKPKSSNGAVDWQDIVAAQRQPQVPQGGWQQPQQPVQSQMGWQQQPMQQLPFWAQSPQQPQQPQPGTLAASPRQMGHQTNWQNQPQQPMGYQQPQMGWQQQPQQQPMQQGGPVFPGGI